MGEEGASLKVLEAHASVFFHVHALVLELYIRMNCWLFAFFFFLSMKQMACSRDGGVLWSSMPDSGAFGTV